MKDKQKVVFIHGATAFTQYDAFLEHLTKREIRDPLGLEEKKRWSNTLRADLGEDFEVYMPQMPNSWNARYEEWKIWFERHFVFLTDGAILIGHSQGGYFLAKYLVENKTSFTIKALYLVAAPFEPDEFEDEDGGDFNFDTTQVGVISDKAGRVFIYHSEDDFVVSFRHAEKYRDAIPSGTLVSFKDRNHFLVPELPELLKSVREVADL